MSSLAKIYSDATGKSEVARKRLEELDAQSKNNGALGAGNSRPIETTNAETITEQELTAQNKVDWLSHPRTTELFQWIGKEIEVCQNGCLTLATQAHLKNTPYDAEKNIVMIQLRITTLKSILEKFSK